MIRISHGIIAVTALCALSFALGSINENDVHRLNKSVANHFFDPVPGKMFEVSEGNATPLCSFSNAADAVYTADPQNKRYINNLGRSLPVARLVDAVVPQLGVDPQVELTWTAIPEGLEIDYRATLDPDCERKAQRAYARNSVVCVVDNVFRAPDGRGIVAVRFKHFAFAPSAAGAAPICPLQTPQDLFWTIRRQLISVSELTAGPTHAGI
ncbi:MAG: hypothetical protein AB3N11_06740 [Arenibacterium sp.]